MSTSNIKVADYIFQEIQKGVDFVPIYQSGNALHPINAVGKTESLESLLITMNVNGLAAEVYGRFKQLGVCCVGAGLPLLIYHQL